MDKEHKVRQYSKVLVVLKPLKYFQVVSTGMLAVFFATTSAAWEEPQRGSDDRKGLMDAIRPHIEWSLGSPVQFVVGQLRVDGDVGYASLMPQRPGGAAIDLVAAPGVQRGELEPEFMDGTRIDVLYRKQRATWVAVHFSIGATDAWFATPDYCKEYSAVIPEFC